MASRVWIFMLVVACPVPALAQDSGGEAQASSSSSQPYEPAVPPPSMAGAYGGYGGWGGGRGGGASTVAGSAMDGMANVISARGDANLANSAAAMNLTQAQSAEIQNRQQATNTYFEMRAENRAAQKAERGPEPTMKELVSVAHQALPAALNSSQMDPVTGKLVWPDVLQGDEFRSQRAQVDQVISSWVTHGGLSHADKSSVRKTIQAMYAKLNAEIRDLTPADYTAGRKFLNSLVYATTKNNLQ